MAILVTGAAGFIGSHTCEKLLKRGFEVIGLDDFNDYYSPVQKRQNAKDAGCKVYEADIRDKDRLASIFSENRIEKVVHLAARAGVRPSIAEPKLYFDVNVGGTLNLLELAREHKCRNFVFASSSSVYGCNEKIPFSEDDVTDLQLSPYAASKKSGEQICRTYSYLYDMNITCLRFFTVYGPRGRPDMAPLKFTQLIESGRPIEMFGDGNSSRDYTYVDDITDGVVSAVEKDLRFEIINLGNSRPVKLMDFIKTVERSLGKEAKITRKPMPKADVPVTYADISKARRLLGYDPKTTIEEGIKRLVDWYR